MARRFTSIFILFLFLFPQVHKSVHDFEHRKDFHCDAKAEKHFHTFEHVCKLCDFSLSGGDETKLCKYDLVPVVFEFDFTIPAIEVFQSNFWQSLPSRAPPVFFS